MAEDLFTQSPPRVPEELLQYRREIVDWLVNGRAGPLRRRLRRTAEQEFTEMQDSLGMIQEVSDETLA